MADDSSESLPLVSVLSELESAFDHPESYLKPPATLQKNTLSAVKQIFDFCKKDELSGKRSLGSTCPLQELLVENFDDEQIWQEIELQNTPLLRALKQDIQDLKERADQLSLLSANNEVVKGNQLQDLDDSFHENVGENTNEFVKSASESDSVNEVFSPDENSNDQTDDDNGDGSDNDDNDVRNDSSKFKIPGNNSKTQNPSKKKTQVDDKFFKLSDMLQFLDKEDKRFERAHKKKSQKQSDDNDDDDDDDDGVDSEPVDYFIDMDSDDTEDEEDEEWNKALGVTESLLGRFISVSLCISAIGLVLTF